MTRVVGHSINNLGLTTNWIYNQLANLCRYKPVAVARRCNFDVSELNAFHCFADLPAHQRFTCRVIRRLTGTGYAYRIFRSYGVALVHSHFGNIGYADLRTVRKLRVPHVTTFYGHDLSTGRRDPEWRERYQQLFAECDRFLTEGPHMRQCLIDLGCPPSRVVVQRLGINLENYDFIPRQPGPDGTIRILAAGTFTEKKGLPYALEAFAIVKSRNPHLDLRLTLVGDVPPGKDPQFLAIRNTIHDVIEKRRLQDCVSLAGYVSRNDFARIARESHIFLSPSVHAKNGDSEGGAPVSILEMSASGMPIVATKHCDIPNVVRDGQSGYLAAERNVEELADKLNRLVQQPDLWPEMGSRGRNHIKEFHDLQHQVRKLEDIYDDLLSDTAETP